VVFGAGIAGLSAAHYLVRQGFQVTVVEALDGPGGMARSERNAADSDVPSEYSWRGFGPWYKNAFAVMKEIPVTPTTAAAASLPQGSVSNVYEDRLSGPIGFHLVADEENPTIRSAAIDKSFRISHGWRLGPWDATKVGWLLFRQWSASTERSEHTYAQENASATLYKHLNPLAAKTASQVFGPFVGVDYGRASTHHVADFFKKNTFPGGGNTHAAKADGTPAWTQRSNSGWVILNRPSNEAWFDPWVSALKRQGVVFRFGESLDRFDADGARSPIVGQNAQPTVAPRVSGAYLGSGERIEADQYILAINPFAAVDVIARSSPAVQVDPELTKFPALTADGPHVQISFQIVFGERIVLPGGRETAVILTDSEFDITLFSQDQLFAKDVVLGQDAVSLWSGTATIDSIPGSLYGKTMLHLTRQEFIDEVMHQILRCQSLNAMVKLANQGRPLADFTKNLRVQVWHGWTFPGDPPGKDGTPATDIVRGDFPKWVNTTHTQLHQPNTATSLSNLWIAGAHTRTSADLWSMEGAVESGKRAAEMAARVPASDSTVKLQPRRFGPLKTADAWLYKHNLPHVLDSVVIPFVAVMIGMSILFGIRKRRRGRGA
jgi:hypothetical protein